MKRATGRHTSKSISDLLHPWSLLRILETPFSVMNKFIASQYHHRILDRVIATLSHDITRSVGAGFFSHGWGRLDSYQRSISILQSASYKNEFPPLVINKSPWRSVGANASLQDWTFPAPFAEDLPSESKTCTVQFICPKEWICSNGALRSNNKGKPLVALLPGTGEQGFVHRRNTVAIPLASDGVGSMIIEGPYYGSRRPLRQLGTKLQRVSDLPILGRATIDETRTLLHHVLNAHGFDNVTVAGSSMGGLHAAMIASLCSYPIGMVAWLAPPSAIPAFISGLLSHSCDWKSLSKDEQFAAVKQMVNDRPEVASMHSFESETAETQAILAQFLAITDIQNFPTPKAPEAAIIALALHDEYIGCVSSEWESLCERWVGASIRTLPVGHVSGILFESRAYRQAILDVFKNYDQRQEQL